MISLADKLARFVGAGEPPPEAKATRPAAHEAAPERGRMSVREALARMRPPRAQAEPAVPVDDGPLLSLEEALPGRAAATARGSAWLSQSHHSADDRHGMIPLGMVCDAEFGHLERVTGDPRLAGFDARRALFLDIEATGLEHGAGTVAFLVGIGFFEGDDVCVQQVLLREPDDEAALLSIVWEAVQRFPYLVSFNGKSFDMSVLQNRMVMHRMCSAETAELKLRPHLDLLHVSRNIYKGLWQDVRLQTLEAQVLGFVRDGDMPGALAPTCWFTWLRDADARPLKGIARHNRMDVLSMVALAGVLAKEAEPRADAGRRSRVALNLARLYVRRKAHDEALAVLADAPPLADFAERVAMLELTATAARRLGQRARQVQALERILALAPERLDVAKALARATKVSRR